MVDHVQIFLIGQKPKKNTATNPINDNDKCFQYAATAALSHKKIM